MAVGRWLYCRIKRGLQPWSLTKELGSIRALLGAFLGGFPPRVLRQSFVSSFQAEKALLARHERLCCSVSFAFGFLVLPHVISDCSSLALFMTSAGLAIFPLERVN